MFIELVDVLRCPELHEETWLVLATNRMDGSDVVEGVLGCPICHAEYPIHSGIAQLDRGRRRTTAAAPPDENEAVRLAALLDLSEPGGYVIFLGETTNHAARLRDLTDVLLLAVDPPFGRGIERGLSGLTTDAESPGLPVAHGSARAIAFDDHGTSEELEARLPIVRAGGRLLAPATLPLPEGVTELARDERQWLAERTAVAIPSGIISIERR